jgi:hypothetical protein
MEDMLGKVPKLKYSYHDVHDAKKFLDLENQTYLEDTWEIGPIGRPIMEPAQWIIGLYNSGIMNLLDIPHFGHSKNVGLCIKQHLSNIVHRDILWMDRIVDIDVALIAKIIGFPTIGAQPEEYLENKV